MESGQIRRPSEAVLAALPDPVVVVEGGAVAWHNAAARELFGLPAAGLDGREWCAVVGEEHEEALLDAQDRARGTDEAVRLSLRRRSVAGADLSLDVAVIADGPRLVHVLRDATAAEAARAGLLAEKRRTDAILAAIDEVIYTDLYLPDGSVEFVHVGPGWERLLGNPPAGLTFDEAWDGAIHPDDDERCAEADDRLRQGEPIEFELRLACYDGVTRTILDRARPTRLSDGSVVVNGVLSDITGRKETEERLREALALAETALRETQSARAELERLSRVDVLTELANRRHFGDVLTFELERARREGESTGLLIVDLDHFKQINDSFGHLAGDEALRECARRISEGTRGYDTVARWGGEEFAVLLPRHPQRRGAARGGRARARGGRVGAAARRRRAARDDGLGRRGAHDLAPRDGGRPARGRRPALYAAKRRGRDRVRIASELTRRDLRGGAAAGRAPGRDAGLVAGHPRGRRHRPHAPGRRSGRPGRTCARTCRARRCCAAGWAGCCTTSARSRCRTPCCRSPGR